MFCNLGEEKRTIFKKKNWRKKEIDLCAAINELIETKGYLKTYNLVKYFLPYLSRF